MTSTIEETRVIRSPRGTEISCLGWQQEAALRMLMNNPAPGGRGRSDPMAGWGLGR